MRGSQHVMHLRRRPTIVEDQGRYLGRPWYGRGGYTVTHPTPQVVAAPLNPSHISFDTAPTLVSVYPRVFVALRYVHYHGSSFSADPCAPPTRSFYPAAALSSCWSARSLCRAAVVLAGWIIFILRTKHARSQVAESPVAGRRVAEMLECV